MYREIKKRKSNFSCWIRSRQVTRLLLYTRPSSHAAVHASVLMLDCTQSLSFFFHSNWETGASERHSRAVYLVHSSLARISLPPVSQLLREKKGTVCSLHSRSQWIVLETWSHTPDSLRVTSRPFNWRKKSTRVSHSQFVHHDSNCN